MGSNELYVNEDGKKFHETGENALIGLTPKSGMNVSFGDIYNKGPDLCFKYNRRRHSVAGQQLLVPDAC
jgi:hypothetical protein